MNNLNNAVKPIPLNDIFVQPVMNNAEQAELSFTGRTPSAASVHVIHPRSRGSDILVKQQLDYLDAKNPELAAKLPAERRDEIVASLSTFRAGRVQTTYLPVGILIYRILKPHERNPGRMTFTTASGLLPAGIAVYVQREPNGVRSETRYSVGL